MSIVEGGAATLTTLPERCSVHSMLMFQTPNRRPDLPQMMRSMLPGLALGLLLALGLRALGVSLPSRLGLSQGAMYFAWTLMTPAANRTASRAALGRRLPIAAAIGAIGGTAIYLVSLSA